MRNPVTPESLATIRVLWRQADSMTLWGIPYGMRPGQQPRDIVRGMVYDRATGRYYERGIPDGWIYLGSPGWWGHLSSQEQEEIQAYLAPLEASGMVPGGPYEWNRTEETDA